MPKNLRCENIINPIGIERQCPELSWQFEGPGLRQDAYRVMVYVFESKKDTYLIIWDSGWIKTSINRIEVGFLTENRKIYKWKVFK